MTSRHNFDGNIKCPLRPLCEEDRARQASPPDQRAQEKRHIVPLPLMMLKWNEAAVLFT